MSYLQTILRLLRFTRVDGPKVIYTDAMITKEYSERTLLGSRVGNLSWISLRLAQSTIKRALREAELAVFGADWAAERPGDISPTCELRLFISVQMWKIPGPK